MTYHVSTGGVTSVAGRTGAVTLGVGDITGLQSALTNIQVSGGGVSAVEFASPSVQFQGTVLANSRETFLAYQITDPNDLSNLLLTSLEMVDTSGIGSSFRWDIWVGDPNDSTANAQLRVTGATVTTGINGYQTDYTSSATAFFINADLKTGIYLAITNLLTSPFSLAFKLEFIAFPPPASPITLPQAPPSSVFTYTGPTGLTTVDVGPGKTFTDPSQLFPLNPDGSQATPYVAPGFTMNVYPGTYYHAFPIPPGYDGWTIQLAPDAKKSDGVTPADVDDVIFNGRGGWVTGFPIWLDDGPPQGGPVNPFRLARGKGFVYTNSPGTIKKISFWYCGGAYGNSVKNTLGVEQNTGDAEAGIYAESFNTLATLYVDHCRFDGNENGIFTNAVSSANVRVQIDHCDFSYLVPNGMSTDGLSHNVYLAGGNSITVNNSNFYDCNGNSFKSRVPTVTINNSFLMQGLGRAIDYPDGGTLTCNSCIFSQKDWSNSTTGRIHNFLGYANESGNNGASVGHMNNCTTHIGYEADFFALNGPPSLTWTGTTQYWYSQPNATNYDIVMFEYDTEHNSMTNWVTGLTFQPSAMPTLIGYPGRTPCPVARQSLV